MPLRTEAHSRQADGPIEVKTPLVRRVLLLLAIFVGQFVVFELGMRAVGGSEAAPAFQRLFMTDPRVGHRLRPGASTHFATSEYATDISINAAGVRGPEIPAWDAGEARIVVLGDSLTFAVQVPQAATFCQRLEDRLRASDAAPAVRVINGGVQGYGPVEELLFYRAVIKPLRPTVVLVMVFVANDAVEAIDSAWRLDDSRPAVEQAQTEATTLSRRVVRRSMVLQTVRLRVEEVRDWLRPSGTPTVSRPLTTYVPEVPDEITRGLALTRDLLAQLRDEAAREGTRVGLVLVPARFQLNDEDYGYLKKSVEAAGEQLLRDKATERFAEALRPLGLPMLDLLPVLRAQPDPAGLFFTENVHFTVRGHEVVADALERFVRDSGLLEPAEQPTGPQQGAAAPVPGAGHAAVRHDADVPIADSR
jgi:lysophospholipase L1-like esterase